MHESDKLRCKKGNILIFFINKFFYKKVIPKIICVNKKDNLILVNAQNNINILSNKNIFFN